MGRVPLARLTHPAGKLNRSAMKWTFRTKLAGAVAAGLLLTVLLGKFWGVGATLLILVIPVRDR